jgi:predicted glutamine amidotransferase
MCIICASRINVRQPGEAAIRRMFANNPHGAGYMFARDGKVHIHKGYMDVESFLADIRAEHFTAKDAVVYHFRISTQAGVNPAMTHPFPLSNKLAHMKALDVECRCGVAHNGIIRLTTDPANKEYSDTALFIADYLSEIIRCSEDLKDEGVLKLVHRLAGSKLAIMDGSGYVATVGSFINEKGLLFSNDSYLKDGRRGW